MFFPCLTILTEFICKTVYRTYVCLQQQLREDQEYLKAASRLSEQLEKKGEQIERLNEEGNYYQRLCISGLHPFKA